MFEKTFVQVFTWGTQNLKLLMPILQCNVVRQMLCILEGLIPIKQQEETEEGLPLSKDATDGNESLSFLKRIELMFFFPISAFSS